MLPYQSPEGTQKKLVGVDNQANEPMLSPAEHSLECGKRRIIKKTRVQVRDATRSMRAASVR